MADQTTMAQAFANAATAGSRPPVRRVFWEDSEWIAMARAIVRMFPDLGAPAPESVSRVRLRNVQAAMREALPEHRHRRLIHGMTPLIPHLAHAFRKLANSPAEAKAPPLTKVGAPPASVIYRQPDGLEKGAPGGKVFWTAAEWYKLAVELAFIEPAYLETLNRLNVADVFRAQRVLDSNRRRQKTTLHGVKVREHLLPVFTRLRAEIAAARSELADARLAAQAAAEAKAAAAQTAETARQAMQNAAQAAEAEAAQFVAAEAAKTLAGASIGSLVEALAERVMTSAQGVIENAIINALSSERVRNALVVNLYVEQGNGTSPVNARAAAPSVKSETPVTVARLPVVAIVGALPQQAAEVANSFPQLRVKHIDKNLTSNELKSAVQNADLIVGMTHFLSHSMDGQCYKAGGDRYKRVDGGISAVRRLLHAWTATAGADVKAA